MNGGAFAANGFRMAINSSSGGSGYVQFWTTQSGGTLNVASSKKIDTSRWYHVAATYANGKGNIYIDGKSVGTASGTYVPASSATAYLNTIGGTPSGDNVYDDLRVFSESLLASEVHDLYAGSLDRHNILAFKKSI